MRTTALILGAIGAACRACFGAVIRSADPLRAGMVALPTLAVGAWGVFGTCGPLAGAAPIFAAEATTVSINRGPGALIAFVTSRFPRSAPSARRPPGSARSTDDGATRVTRRGRRRAHFQVGTSFLVALATAVFGTIPPTTGLGMTAFAGVAQDEYEFGEVLAFLGFNVVVEGARVEDPLPAELGWFVPDGRYVVVEATVVRTGDEPFEFFNRPLALQDSQGRLFKPAVHETRSLRRQRGVAGDLAPGGSYQVPTVFDVAADARDLRLTNEQKPEDWYVDLSLAPNDLAATPGPIPQPIGTLDVGETVEAPAWDVTVTGVGTTQHIRAFSTEGRYVVLSLRVRNRLDVPITFPFSDLRIVNEQGMRLEIRGNETVVTAEERGDTSYVRGGPNEAPTTAPLPPGQEVEVVAVFQVGADAGQLWLEPALKPIPAEVAGGPDWSVYLGPLAEMPSA